MAMNPTSSPLDVDGGVHYVLVYSQRFDCIFVDSQSRFSGLAHCRAEEGGITVYHIIYRNGGNLIRVATPYASADEAHEEAEILRDMKIEVVEIVYTA